MPFICKCQKLCNGKTFKFELYFDFYKYTYIHIYTYMYTYIYIYTYNIYIYTHTQIYSRTQPKCTLENHKDVKLVMCHSLVLFWHVCLFNHLRFLLIQTDNLHVLFILVHLHIIYIYIYIDMLHYLTWLSDIYVIYLIHMQREGAVTNGRSTACHGLNLVLDLHQKVLKFLVFLSNSSLYLSVLVLEPLLMYS